MPVGFVRRLAAGDGYLFESGNQWFGAVEQCIHVSVRLALEVTHVKAENKSEIDQKNTDDDNTGYP
jgi:hypothetical protein